MDEGQKLKDAGCVETSWDKEKMITDTVVF